MKQNRSTDSLALRHFRQVAMHHKKDFLLSWLTPVSAIGGSVVIPYFIGKIIGSLAVPGSQEFPLVVGLAVAAILTVIINQLAFGSYFILQPKIMAELQTEALTVLLRRGAGFHNNRVSGKLVSDVSDYTNGFSQLSNTVFIDVLPFLATIVIGLIVVGVQSLFLGAVLLLMAAVSIGSSLYLRRRMRPYRQQRQAAGKAVIAHAADSIVNNQTVKTFGNEAYELQTHGTLNKTLLSLRIRDWKLLAKDGTERLAALYMFEVLFVLVLIYEVHHNPALLATGIFAFSYTVTLSNRLFQIGNMMRNIEESLLQIVPMTEILHEDIEIVDTPDATQLQVTQGAVAFHDVAFGYQDSNTQDTVFKKLNLIIKGGEKVGLVGPSGGGKTTLTKLILRFEDISSGSITIDGQSLADITQRSLRQAIAYVSQEPLLFHRSIRDNIAYGNPDATDQQIQEAARKAYTHEFITGLTSGYDTVVGERGVKLSGGQRQRIAIARAILKESPILMLDEATSALDSASERLIQSALSELMKDKTALVIAHRLSTIQQLDRIIVLNDGAIVEQGTHSELIKKDGLYAELWKHQSGGFINE